MGARMNMRTLIVLICSAAIASAQPWITVTSDTNGVVRGGFTMASGQIAGLDALTLGITNITGLQSALDGKLATNGSATNLTNFPSELLRTNGSAAGLTNFPAELLRTNGSAASLTNFPAELLRTNGDGSGLTNLPNSDLGSATGILPISNGGTGATNALDARNAILPAMGMKALKYLRVSGDETYASWEDVPPAGITNVDLSSTNVTGVLSASHGGTGLTNIADIFTAAAVYTTNDSVRLGDGAYAGTNVVSIGKSAAAVADGAVAIGSMASSIGGATNGIAIGNGAFVGSDCVSSIAIGAESSGAYDAGVIAIGGNVYAQGTNAISIGMNSSTMTNGAVQIGEGTNSVENSIQFSDAGAVSKSAWTALSGGITTNVAAGTNTLHFTNGILMSVTH